MTVSEKENLEEAKNDEKSSSEEHQVAIDMLQEFGLSPHETAVYIALLESGKALGGSLIAQMARIPRQYVYTVLPMLIEQGLVLEIPYGKQSRYQAIPENEFEKIAKRKLVQTEKLVRELSTFSKIGYEQDFEVIQGDQAIQQYELESVELMGIDTCEYIIGGASQGFSKTMGSKLQKYLNGKTKKNIAVKYIGNEEEKAEYKKFANDYPNQEYRFMKNLPQGVAHMVVRDDSVSFYTFLNPSLIYIVKSAVVAKNYKDFFLMLWEMAADGK